MTNPECPICDNVPLAKESAIIYPSGLKRNQYLKKILFCPQCTLGVGYPLPTADFVEKIYSRTEYWGKSIQGINFRKQAVMYALAKARWSLIDTYLKQKANLKIIDVGSGYGYLGLVSNEFTNIMLEKYISVESDKRLHEELNKAWLQSNPNTKISFYTSLERVYDKGNILALSHILEHVLDPLDFMKKASMLLSTSGLVFIDVPNCDYEFKSEVFPHLLFFSEESLRKLLEKAGLKVLHISTWGTSKSFSPMNENAPRLIHFACYMLNRFSIMMPKKIAIKLYAKLFGTNRQNKVGVWLRAIALKTN